MSTQSPEEMAELAREIAQDITDGKPMSFLDMNNYADEQSVRIFELLQKPKSRKGAMKEIEKLQNSFAGGKGNHGTSGMIITRLQGLGVEIELACQKLVK